MAACKICGRTISAGKVFHPMCWEVAAKELSREFCDEYCRFPRECEDLETLRELHCADCVMVRVMKLGM